MRRLTRWLLSLAETLFLRTHGWKRNQRDEWDVPFDYFFEKKRGRRYTKGHAVNSQKLTNRHLRLYERDDKMQLLHAEDDSEIGDAAGSKSGVGPS